jgi:hypothetical protein
MTRAAGRPLTAGAVDPMTTSRGAVCTAHSDHEQRGPSGRGAQRRHWLFRRGDRGGLCCGPLHRHRVAPQPCATRRRRAGAADRPAQLLAGRRDLDDLGQQGHGPPEHSGGEQDAQGLSGADRPPAPPGTGSSDHRLVFEVLSGTRAAPEPAVSSRRVCWSCGAGWGPPADAGTPSRRSGLVLVQRASSATKSGVGELLAMRPGGRLLPRPALHSGPRSPVARSVP